MFRIKLIKFCKIFLSVRIWWFWGNWFCGKWLIILRKIVVMINRLIIVLFMNGFWCVFLFILILFNYCDGGGVLLVKWMVVYLFCLWFLLISFFLRWRYFMWKFVNIWFRSLKGNLFVRNLIMWWGLLFRWL